MARSERRGLIERPPAELSLQRQAELLSLSRASLYYQPTRPSAEELAIKRRIDELYTAHPFYGSRKILVELRKHWSIKVDWFVKTQKGPMLRCDFLLQFGMELDEHAS